MTTEMYRLERFFLFLIKGIDKSEDKVSQLQQIPTHFEDI